jgi:hypothetical protein
MNAKVSILLAVLLVLAFATPFAYYGLNQNRNPENSPSPSFSVSPHPTLTPHVLSTAAFVLSEYSVNVSEGETFTVNATVISLTDTETVTSLAVTLLGFNNSAFSGDAQHVFNASFSQNPIVLAPQENQSVTVTLTVAADAPVGRYVLAVGNVQFVVTVNPFDGQVLSVNEVLADPSLYVNQPVCVQGILAAVALPSPTRYGLFPENQTNYLNVNWASNLTLMRGYNDSWATVHGVVREEDWFVPNVGSSNITMHIYYLDADKVELLNPSNNQ